MHSDFREKLNRLANRVEDLSLRQRLARCADPRYLDEANAAVQLAHEYAGRGEHQKAWGVAVRAEYCLFWVRHDLDHWIALHCAVREVFQLQIATGGSI
jgi:hypothetical protein